MHLKPEQIKTLIDHVNAKWKRHECDRCNTNDWEIIGYVSMSLTPHPSQLVGGAASLTTAAFVCKNCGNTRLINLVIAGVWKNA